MLLFIFNLILASQISWAMDPLDFNAELQRQSFKDFIGTYQGFSNDELGSLQILGNHLQFSYILHGMVFMHFSIPTSLENTKNFYSTMGLSFGSDETIYSREDNQITKTRTTKNQLRKIIDITTVTLTSETQLKITRSRKYFHKKNFFYGPWIVDSTSYIAKADSVNSKYHFFKSSINPTSYSYLSNFAQAQNRALMAASNYMEAYLSPYSNQNSDEISDPAENQKINDSERGQVVQIDDFRRNCHKFLR